METEQEPINAQDEEKLIRPKKHIQSSKRGIEYKNATIAHALHNRMREIFDADWKETGYSIYDFQNMVILKIINDNYEKDFSQCLQEVRKARDMARKALATTITPKEEIECKQQQGYQRNIHI